MAIVMFLAFFGFPVRVRLIMGPKKYQLFKSGEQVLYLPVRRPHLLGCPCELIRS